MGMRSLLLCVGLAFRGSSGELVVHATQHVGLSLLQLHAAEHYTEQQRCANIGYVRIQKTGSTSLGEHIMPALCQKANMNCSGEHHWDYRMALAKANGRQKCVLTMLRDPVERFLSEFAMMRSDENFHLKEWQWDWREEDWGKLLRLEGKGVNGVRNRSEAAYEYLQEPVNPTRNRQTLYMLGFDRIPDGFPAAQYDWEKNGANLLERAKYRLVRLLGFGISECYVDSVVDLAERAGWDKQLARTMASSVHSREQEREHALLMDTFNDSQPVVSGRRIQIEPRLVQRIRELNHLDEELLQFARAEFYRRTGKHCPKEPMEEDSQAAM